MFHHVLELAKQLGTRKRDRVSTLQMMWRELCKTEKTLGNILRNSKVLRCLCHTLQPWLFTESSSVGIPLKLKARLRILWRADTQQRATCLSQVAKKLLKRYSSHPPCIHQYNIMHLTNSPNKCNLQRSCFVALKEETTDHVYKALCQGSSDLHWTNLTFQAGGKLDLGLQTEGAEALANSSANEKFSCFVVFVATLLTSW